MKKLATFLAGAALTATVLLLAGAAPVRYPITCTAISNVALSTASETVIAEQTKRKKFCLVNGDASIAIHVAFHATATTADAKVGPGGSICETVEDGYNYTGVVDVIAASGTPAISGWSCQ